MVYRIDGDPMKLLTLTMKIYKQIIATVPYSSWITVLAYLLFAFAPGFITYINSRLFYHVYRYTPGNGTSWIVISLGVIFVLIFVAKSLMFAISSISINVGVYEKITHYLRIQLSVKTAKLPMLDFEDAEKLNQFKRAQDCVEREIIPQIFMITLSLVSSFVGIIGIAVVLASYNIWFIPIVIISVTPYFISRIIRGKEFYSLKWFQAKKHRKLSYLWKLFGQSSSIKEMRLMGFDQYMINKWRSLNDEINEEIWSFGKKDSISLLICDLIKLVGYLFSLILAFQLTLKGDINIGVFGSCILALSTIQDQTKILLSDFGSIPEKTSFAHDYYSFLETPEAPPGTQLFCGLREGILMDKVSFMYPNAATCAVKNISLNIRKGEKVAIVGENGSGKSTLSKLIIGLYTYDMGSIKYDDHELADIDKSSLFQYVSAISQRVFPYHFTVRESVALGQGLEEIRGEDEAIYALLQSLDLDCLAGKDGLQIQLGKEFGGRELSGGQWQKLSIARALYKQSEIVLLDEPTSALDPIMETEVLSNLIKIAEDKTAIIVSHRVGLCKYVDKIIVMKNNEIVEIGTHEQLIEEGNEYHRLYSAQQKWYI